LSLAPEERCGTWAGNTAGAAARGESGAARGTLNRGIGGGQGTTEDEALANIADAIELCLEVRAERAFSPAIGTREIDVTA
jgi:hypothetical protein